MKIGFLQFEPVLGCQGETLRRVEYGINQSDPWDLLVLPELADTGYNLPRAKKPFRWELRLMKTLFCLFWRNDALKRVPHVVTGFCERDGDHLFNSAAVIGPKGLIGIYRKLHLFAQEKDTFSPGDKGLPVFDIGHCKIGVQICFDWMFPETWRILALKGADIICHPANLVLPHSQKVTPVYSLTNRVFTITANRTGTEGELTFTGTSQITDPGGNIISRAGGNTAVVETIHVDIASASNKMITPRNHAFDDRRPEEYGELIGR